MAKSPGDTAMPNNMPTAHAATGRLRTGAHRSGVRPREMVPLLPRRRRPRTRSPSTQSAIKISQIAPAQVVAAVHAGGKAVKSPRMTPASDNRRRCGRQRCVGRTRHPDAGSRPGFFDQSGHGGQVVGSDRMPKPKDGRQSQQPDIHAASSPVRAFGGSIRTAGGESWVVSPSDPRGNSRKPSHSLPPLPHPSCLPIVSMRGGVRSPKPAPIRRSLAVISPAPWEGSPRGAS